MSTHIIDDLADANKPIPQITREQADAVARAVVRMAYDADDADLILSALGLS